MAISFNETFYLEQKLAQLQAAGEAGFETTADVQEAFATAGLTAEAHYLQHGVSEGLNPSADFDTNVYLDSKLAQLSAAGGFENITTREELATFLKDSGLSPLEHYNQHGAAEGVSPSAEFNAQAYLANKLADLQANDTDGTYADWTTDELLAFFNDNGLTPLDHYTQFGRVENISPLPVEEGSELTEALATLKSAQDAKAEFLFNYAQDPEVEGEEAPAVDADVTGALTAAAQNVEDLLVDVAAGNQFVESSTAVRAAMIADQQEANAEALTKAQANLEKAQADVAQVTGLTQAVNNLKAAQEAEKEAGEAVTEARATLNSTVASYNTFNDAAPIAAVNADGTVDGLIELNAKGNLVLVAGVSEEDNKGITAVLNASIAKEEADAALVDAQEATGAAQDVVDNLDLSEAAVAKLGEVAAAMTVVELAEGELPSPGQIQSEIAGLEALVATAEASVGDTTAAQLQADADAAVAADAFDVTGSVYADYAGALAADVVTLQGELTAATTAVTNFDALLAAYSSALSTYNADTSVAQSQTDLVTAYDNLRAGFTIEPAPTDVATSANADATIATTEDAAAIAAADADTQGAAAVEVSSLDSAVVTAQANLDVATEADALDALITASSFADFDAALTADATQLQVDADAAVAAEGDVAAAQQNLADFEALVGQYNTLADENPLLTALTNAENAISNDAETGIQDQIDALAEAVTDLQEAQGDVAELQSLNDAIDAAEKTFTDNDYLVPVTLEEGANLATADSDIFLAGEAGASTIANFGLLGEDSLFIGSDYTLNTGDIETDGDNSVLEVFMTQDGANTIISLETEVFGSNSTDAEQTITLTGVSVDQLNFEGGLVTIVEVA